MARGRTRHAAMVAGVVHTERFVSDTRALRVYLERIFARVSVEERPFFASRGRENCQFHRDALWFCRPDEDGLLPLYRTHKDAKTDPRRHHHRISDVPVPDRMDPLIESLCDDVWRRLGLSGTPNHAVIHRYVDGNDQITYHHDKWMDQEPGSHIACVSVGAARTFQIGIPYEKTTRLEEAHTVADGDCVSLSYLANQTYKHQIRRTSTDVGVRYSVTIRCMDTHYEPTKRLLRTRYDPRVALY